MTDFTPRPVRFRRAILWSYVFVAFALTALVLAWLIVTSRWMFFPVCTLFVLGLWALQKLLGVELWPDEGDDGGSQVPVPRDEASP